MGFTIASYLTCFSQNKRQPAKCVKKVLKVRLFSSLNDGHDLELLYLHKLPRWGGGGGGGGTPIYDMDGDARRLA